MLRETLDMATKRCFQMPAGGGRQGFTDASPNWCEHDSLRGGMVRKEQASGGHLSEPVVTALPAVDECVIYPKPWDHIVTVFTYLHHYRFSGLWAVKDESTVTASEKATRLSASSCE